MPVFKNEDNGTWYVMARYVNWKGERKQKCKRGFATKKEAQEWERMFQLQNSSDMDMSFEAFTELYIRDMKSRLKENTWLTKEHIIRTKILPYFVPIGKHLILPCDNLFCGNLTDFQLAEIRQNLRADDMLLCQPCVLFQTAFHIPDIQFGKGFKTHIKVRSIL